MPAKDLDQIVNLCKRRGFVFPSAEIYGGFRSSYDYGPLGSLMLRNVKEAWVRTMVQQRDDTVLIDAAILGPPQVFEASDTLRTSLILLLIAPCVNAGFAKTILRLAIARRA